MNEQTSSVPLLVKLCSDRAAYEVRVQRKVMFNLEKVKQLFESCHDQEVVVYTPHMIILRSGKTETTLSKDGRMLIKKAANEAEATRVAQTILRAALPAIVSKP